MKKITLVLSIFFLTFSLFACSKKEENKDVANKKKDELVVALANEPESGFDPILGYGMYGSPIVQSTLLDVDKDLNITSDLATKYDLSNNGLIWTFHLRDDITFTDGKKVTAEDVVFTYKTAKESGSTVDLHHLKEAKVINDNTVQFTLDKPLSTFVYSAASIGIVPKHAYSKDYANNPIGSGPYKLAQWNKGQQAIFIRNEDYYGKKPYFKKVTVLFMSEDAAYAAAKAGQVDVAQTSNAYATNPIKGMNVEAFQTVDNRGISFVTIPKGSKVNEKNAGNDVTSDIAIRKAINLAIDRNKIVEDALGGYGKQAFSNCDDLPWWNENSVITFDKNKAIIILEEAGWKDSNNDGIREKGKIIAEFNLIYNAGDSARQAISMSVKQQLADIGITVNVKGGSWDDIEKKMYEDAVLFGWGNRNPIELFHLYHSSNIGFDWYNTNSYSNKKVDSALSQALVSGNVADWKKAQDQIIEDSPWAWLVNVDHLYFVRDGLNLGKQPIHPHDHALIVLNNIEEWNWEK